MSNYIDGRTLKKYYCLDCRKQLINIYAKRCRKCANIKSIKLRMKIRRSYKGKNNPLFGKTREDLIKYNQAHPQKGIQNPAYKDGRTLKISYCKDCNTKIKFYQRKTGLCQKCYIKTRKIWNKNKKIGNKICKHHIDLNKNNNQKDNILYLTNFKHQSFHRLAYHYLLETFGIKEILKYKKWFFRRNK